MFGDLSLIELCFRGIFVIAFFILGGRVFDFLFMSKKQNDVVLLSLILLASLSACRIGFLFYELLSVVK